MAKNTPSGDSVLGIALSTMDGRLAQNGALVQQLAALAAPVVVVNQLRDGNTGALSLAQLGWSKDVAYIVNTNTLGLSRSRNEALKTIPARWVVLADDDIGIIPEEFDALALRLKTDPSLGADSSVGALATRLMKDAETPWRQYPQDSPPLQGQNLSNLRKIQRINSMELVLNKHWLQHANISFDERLGLGAPPTNGGEEVVLLNELLQRGGQILFIDRPLRLHPDDSSGQTVNAKTSFTQGAVHWMVFGATRWWLLLIVFAAKRLRNGDGSAILHYVKGGVWASRQA